jgi:hypothetical protein
MVGPAALFAVTVAANAVWQPVVLQLGMMAPLVPVPVLGLSAVPCGNAV